MFSFRHRALASLALGAWLGACMAAPPGRALEAPRDEDQVTQGFSEGLAPVAIGGRMGYLNHAGQLVIPARFERAHPFHEGLARVTLGGRTGFSDRHGAMAFWLAGAIQDVSDFSNGLAARHGPTHEGYLDHAGKPAIPARFDLAFPFHEGRGRVKVGERYGFVDPQGAWVVRPLWERADDYAEGLARVEGERNAYLDLAGKVAFETDQDFPKAFSEGLAVVGGLSPNGYIDRSGRLVIPARFAGAEGFSGGLAVVRYHGDGLEPFGFIDRAGQPAFAGRFEEAHAFSGGLAAVRQGDLAGFVDKRGRWVIPARFDAVEPFAEGLALVAAKDRNGRQEGFIDATGHLAIPIVVDGHNLYAPQHSPATAR